MSQTQRTPDHEDSQGENAERKGGTAIKKIIFSGTGT